MKTIDLIRAILRAADNRPRAQAEHVVDPLRYFGQVWFAEGHWRFSEQRAEISTYTANGGSSNVYGEGQFEVKQPTPEQVQEAIDAWNSGEIFGYGKLKGEGQ